MRIPSAARRPLRALGALALAAGLSAGAARPGAAADAVTLQAWDGGAVDAALPDVGQKVTAGGSTLAASMANNPMLHGSAWAHTGSWWNVYVGDAPHVVIRAVAADPGQLAPGLAVWAGDAPFDGGTESWGGQISTAGFGTPHSFNAFSPLGADGTLWMAAGAGGNAVELLGYAVAGPSWPGLAGWGETIETGAHDLRLTDDYARSVDGSVTNGSAVLRLHGVQAGWLTIYVGGTDPARAGGAFDLDVRTSACGLGGEAALVLPLLGAWRRRRRARG